MLNIGLLGVGAADYYVKEAVGATADGYYLTEEQPAGVWIGALAAPLGLEGHVEPEAFRRLLAGHHPGTGERLAAGRGQIAVDPTGELLTTGEAAARLRVSERRIRYLLAAGERGAAESALRGRRMELGGRTVWRVAAVEVARFAGQGEHRRRPGFDLTFRPPKSVSVLWALSPDHREAVETAHRAAIHEVVAYLERDVVLARSGASRELVSTKGVIAAAFDHQTSRAGDPLLHTHVVVANLTQTESGDWRAIFSKALFREARSAGFLYQAHLRHQLTRVLGLAWTPVHNGVAEVEGIPDRVLRTFSKRRAEIQRAVESSGHSTAGGHQAATLATRPQKGPETATARWAHWRAEAEGAGYAPERVVTCCNRAAVEVPRARQRQAVAERLAGPEGVTELRSTFARRDVIAAVCESYGANAPADWLVREAKGFLETDRAVPLNDAAPATRRYSVPGLLRTEAELLEFAATGRSAAGARPEAVAAALGARPQLSEEQRTMIRSVTEPGRAVRVVVGRAGSGKTSAIEACVGALRSSGIPVLGCTVTALAAAQLERAAGFALAGSRATTMASLLGTIERSGGLATSTFVFVDEASTAPTRDLARLAGYVRGAGGALVLVGDPDQHGSVRAGGVFQRLASTPVARLEANHRQRDPQERSAVALYRRGKVAGALELYDRNGKIRPSPTMASAQESMIAGWVEARDAGRLDPMIAGPNATRRELNRRARDILLARGELGDETIEIGGREFRVGDEVLARRNDRSLTAGGSEWVRNGSIGRVTDLRPHARAVVVEFQDVGNVVVPERYLALGRLDHAYARTTYSVQGSTLEQTRYLVGDSDGYEAAYVAITRAQSRTTIHVVEGEIESECDVDRPGSPPRRSSLDAIKRSLRRRRSNEVATASERGLELT